MLNKTISTDMQVSVNYSGAGLPLKSKCVAKFEAKQLGFKAVFLQLHKGTCMYVSSTHLLNKRFPPDTFHSSTFLFVDMIHRRLHPTETDRSIEQHIIKSLKCAADRDGGRRRRLAAAESAHYTSSSAAANVPNRRKRRLSPSTDLDSDNDSDVTDCDGGRLSPSMDLDSDNDL